MPIANATKPRLPRLHAVLAGLALAFATAASATVPQAPRVDTSALPASPNPGRPKTPPRQCPRAADVGRAAFNQACAGCHGTDAGASHSAAPDLRRLGRSCARVRDPGLRQRCLQDANHYFRKSVLKGKTKVGIEHMPAWEDVLTPELVWAIRSFVESRDAPRN